MSSSLFSAFTLNFVSKRIYRIIRTTSIPMNTMYSLYEYHSWSLEEKSSATRTEPIIFPIMPPREIINFMLLKYDCCHDRQREIFINLRRIYIRNIEFREEFINRSGFQCLSDCLQSGEANITLEVLYCIDDLPLWETR